MTNQLSPTSPPPTGPAPQPQFRRPGRGDNDTRTLLRIIVVFVGVLILVASFAAILAIMLLAGDDETNSGARTSTNQVEPADDVEPAEPAEPAEPVEPAPGGTVDTPTDTTPATISDNKLTLRGMGVVTYGMSVSEAEAALGTDLVFQSGTPTECDYATVAGDPDSPHLMVVTDNGDVDKGIIVRIDLLEGQTTRSGIGFGSTKAAVLSAYGDRIVASPHKFDPAPGSEYLTYVPVDAADADYRVIMETSGDVVRSVRSGVMPYVDWVEGCA